VCETGSPSRLMRTLIGKGLVEASHDDADGRVTRLHLTTGGTKAAAGVAEAEQTLYTVMAAAISRRDAKAACELLRSIVGELPTGRALARRIADGA
jgi:MarR family transcriptional regulator, organic hydroperoxide resistance regulator